MSNYPPGVTGNEYEISGPDFEAVMVQSCACGWIGTVDVTGKGFERWWYCPECFEEHIDYIEPNFPDLPDDIPN